MKYRTAKAKAWKEKCAKGGRNSQAAQAAKRLDSQMPPRPRRKGEFLGVLELRLADDAVRRWVFRQGPRRNNVSVTLGRRSVICGWDALFNGIRPHLAVITRQTI